MSKGQSSILAANFDLNSTCIYLYMYILYFSFLMRGILQFLVAVLWGLNALLAPLLWKFSSRCAQWEFPLFFVWKFLILDCAFFRMLVKFYMLVIVLKFFGHKLPYATLAQYCSSNPACESRYILISQLSDTPIS